MFKINLVLICCFVYVKSQSESENTCNGPPTFNCNCGVDSIQTPPSVSSNIQQGRPGKLGAKGDQGQRGQKGSKGDPGTPDDTTAELESLREEVNQLRSMMLTPPQSCDHINGTASQSGFYLISPDPPRVLPFYVYCNFTNVRETVITHDSRNEIAVNPKCEERRCYRRQIQYTVALPQIVALIGQSAQCRQFIKYRCVGSAFLHYNPSYATWLSRDGNAMLYWGGATSQRDRYCACGETNTCIDNNYKCNCDAERYPQETSDEGFLTDKDTLPVTELQFGDTGGSHEFGWHTLGPLICSGRSIQ